MLKKKVASSNDLLELKYNFWSYLDDKKREYILTNCFESYDKFLMGDLSQCEKISTYYNVSSSSVNLYIEDGNNWLVLVAKVLLCKDLMSKEKKQVLTKVLHQHYLWKDRELPEYLKNYVNDISTVFGNVEK